MRGKLLITATVAAGVLAGCTQADQPAKQSPASTSTQPPSSTAPQAPPVPEPVAGGPCPYLETGWVARTNGQRVSKVRVSQGDPPACFFYTLNGKQQVSVRVYTGDATVSKAIVSDAAPVRRSNPADEPAGWQGGYMSTADGAVYAVYSNGTAVVATTNQKQSVKAREIVEKVISTLGL